MGSQFIMIDGMDGSGKSTIVKAWTDHLAKQNKKILDIKDYWKKYGTHPDEKYIKDYDVIISCEPTSVGIGAVIRTELINHNYSYSPEAIAHAFSLDRLVLYTKTIVPALNLGKTIIQDRGVSTSLCYQSIQDKMNMRDIAQLPGNTFALKHRPDHLIIAELDPTEALKRVTSRHDKQDDSIFEKEEFLNKARNCFLSNEFKSIFTSHGTTVQVFNCEDKIDIMKEKAKEVLQTIIN